ncbi:MAG TPA: SCE4755 family polysaccharide monooxygenase-like protein [Polyangiaceae bacterium]|nr:SCE4755 family polysaccharide monooxygenase-like protein [Polyangiaceae bacterium]
MRKPASLLGRQLASVALFGFTALFASSSHAHFVLKSPAAWATQDALGSPQKSAPCGQSDPGAPATATGTVTAFRPGETITITIDETVFHPGHYRVLLATKSRSDLPADPPVTAGDTPCGSTAISSAPVFPLLVDGALKHTAPFAGPQSIEVQLPSDVTCDKCTLQVVEFMSDHGLNNPGGCFYHHCADISIQPQGGQSGGAGAPSAGASGQGSNAASGGGANAGEGSGGRTSGGAANEGGRTAVGGATVVAGGPSGGGLVGLAGSDAGGQPSDVGCSCSTPGGGSVPALAILSALAGIALFRARRR